MDDIRKWLNEQAPDFDQGFVLFCKYSRNQSLMSYIGRKKKMELLKYEMEKLSKMKILSPNPHFKAQYNQFSRAADSPETHTPKVVVMDERKIKREDLPVELQELYDLNVDDYKKLRSYHEKMKNANSDAGRKEFREKISKLEASIKKRWSIIDSGEIPKVEDPTANMNLNTARAYISKMMKVANLTEKQREMVKERYNELLTAGAAIKPETLSKLKEKGF